MHSQFFNSQAETTITHHSNTSPSLNLSKPLVVKRDDKIYPRNPTNGYVTNFYDGFLVVLVVLLLSNIFRECKDHRDKAVRSVYWQKLWTHVSKTRKEPSLTLSQRSPLILLHLTLFHFYQSRPTRS